ncbi:MAG TPA: triose-phosphate isomerase [Candidatus Onthovivens sp.]|nr:triose-phosphate isomerase [Candidatus Onthovivens sp.]
MRRKLLLGNWKMNKTVAEATFFATEAKTLGKEAKKHKIDMGICVPFTALSAVKKILKKSLIVGAQNCHHLNSGAYTGEISIPMLQELNIDTCLVGHSERREYNNETNETCNLKLKALLAAQMTPVYCCGESLTVFEEGNTKTFVKEQIEKGFEGISAEDAIKVIVAYEPIWSIGTGKNASKEIAEDVIAFIRKTLKNLYGTKISNKIRILYGGSVKPNNIKEYLSQKNIDGALVGGASLDATSYKELLTNLI